MRRFLIVNPYGIGDVLFSTPLVRSIRTRVPDAVIGFVANARTAELVQTHPAVDVVFVVDPDAVRARWQRAPLRAMGAAVRGWRRLRRYRFEVAVDLSRNDRYGLVLQGAGIRRRVGLGGRGRGRFLTDRVPVRDEEPPRHMAETYLETLRVIGLAPVPGGLEYVPRPADHAWAAGYLAAHRQPQDGGLVALVPGGGASWGRDAWRKRWSPSGFAAVGRAWGERYGDTVVVVGDGADQPVVAAVARGVGSRTLVAPADVRLGQLAALLGRCRVVVGNDGGGLHLAVAQGVPTVSIFGPVDDRVYGPYPRSARHRVVRHAVPCHPCYRGFRLDPCAQHRCMEGVSVAQVMAEALACVEGARGGRSDRAGGPSGGWAGEEVPEARQRERRPLRAEG